MHSVQNVTVRHRTKIHRIILIVWRDMVICWFQYGCCGHVGFVLCAPGTTHDEDFASDVYRCAKFGCSLILHFKVMPFHLKHLFAPILDGFGGFNYDKARDQLPRTYVLSLNCDMKHCWRTQSIGIIIGAIKRTVTFKIRQNGFRFSGEAHYAPQTP